MKSSDELNKKGAKMKTTKSWMKTIKTHRMKKILFF